MAKKGQKFAKYDNTFIQEIVNELKKGIPATRLSKENNIPLYTVKTWKRKFVNHPELYPNAGVGSGRPKEKDLTKEDYKERFEILKKYRAFLKEQRERKLLLLIYIGINISYITCVPY